MVKKRSLDSFSYKTLLTILILLLIGIILTLRLNQKPTSSASASWWDENWSYRKAFIITENSNNNVDNYPVKITLNNLGTKIQTDCDDIRITDINSQIIASQVETCNPSSDTFVWFQTNLNANESKTFYVYYGNPTASTYQAPPIDSDLSASYNSSTHAFSLKNSHIELKGDEDNASGAIRNLIDVTTGLDSAQTATSNDRVDYNYEGVLGDSRGVIGSTVISNDGSIFKKITWNEDRTGYLVNKEAILFANFPMVYLRYRITNRDVTVHTFSSAHHTMTESGRCYSFSSGNRCSAAEGDSAGGDINHGWFIDSADNIGMCKIRSNNTTTSAGWRSGGAPSPALTLNPSETSSWYEYYLRPITTSNQCDTYANLIYVQQPTISSNTEESSPAPIAFWKLDEGVGTTAFDSAGDNPGSLNGAAWATEEQCVSGSCLLLGGDGDRVTITDKGDGWDLDLNGDITISAWIKPNSISRASILCKHYNYEFDFAMSENGGFFFWHGDGTYEGASIGSNHITAGQWHHVVARRTMSDKKILFYVNGKQVEEWNFSKNSLSASNSPIEIGSRWGGNNFNGLIDEVKVYPFARTPQQILSDYNDGLSGISSQKGSSVIMGSPQGASQLTPPVAHYKFDEGHGSTVNDSISSTTGTSYGADWSVDGKLGKALKVVSNDGTAILNYTTWKEGQTGSVTDFSQNGSTSENYRVLDTDPWGRKVPVWEARPDSTSGADGGWGTSTFTIDNTKLYRFSTWVNRTVKGTDGRFYLGTNGYGSVNGVILLANGSVSTNPYFWNSVDLPENEWILVVGHIQPHSHVGTTTHPDSGRYSSNGTKIGNISYDFKWLPESTSARHRSYLYYTTDTSVRQQWVYPRVDIVDGSEPSIQDLINGYDSYGDDIVVTVPDPKETITFWYDPNSTGNWQHLAKSGSTYYVDGLLATPGQFPAYILGDEIFLGRTASSDFITGSIDEFKVYDYALDAYQIKMDINQNSSHVMGAASQTFGTATNSLEYCLPGDNTPCLAPIAEWNFEENIGTTAFDISTHNHHAVFGTGNSAPSWAAARNGAALKFNGTSNYVTNDSLMFPGNTATISFWAKCNPSGSSAYKPVFVKSNGTNSRIDMGFSTNCQNFYPVLSDNSSHTATNLYTSGNYTNWNHFSISVDTNEIKVFINGTQVKNYTYSAVLDTLTAENSIGKRGSEFFSGLIDNIRIYDYARTPAQIVYDYNKGAPVAHWKLDECQGTTVYDASGNNHGTLSIGTSGTQSSAGTCQTSGTAWGNGASGTRNSSLSFDGADDFIDGISQLPITTNPNLFTVTGYINPNNQNSFFITPNSCGMDHWISYNADNQRLYVSVTESTDTNQRARYSTTGSVPLDTWTHWAVSINNKNLKIFINGKLNAEYNETIDICGWSGDWHIGQRGNGTYWLSGKLDDIRVYNYELTAEQVKTLYNNGAVSFQ
ncbi:MAG: DUF2341 domain-containing protein [Patescibacteria group bacterium]